MANLQVVPSAQHLERLHDILRRLGSTGMQLEESRPLGEIMLTAIYRAVAESADELAEWADEFRADTIGQLG